MGHTSIILDASSILSILFEEEDAEFFARHIVRVPNLILSAINYMEVAIRIDRLKRPVISRNFETVLESNQVKIHEVNGDQAYIARLAYKEFGKGNHKAGLNFGDCFAYALAKSLNAPLLFKGNDFIHTDVEKLHPAMS
jgi:ribonuclease VapC